MLMPSDSIEWHVAQHAWQARADLAADQLREAREALEFVERRSRQPGEDHFAYYERIADEFYQRHGFLAPGKDDPMNSVPVDDRDEAWKNFLNEPICACRETIAKLNNQDHSDE
jgi:hypothetical protein